MTRLALLLALVLPVPPASAQAPSPAPPKASEAAEGLVGVWVATGEDSERLEFRADGSLLVDGVALRYELSGKKLALLAEGQRIEATWRIVAGELAITLRLPDGGARTERYRRLSAEEAKLATRMVLGRVSLELPPGWTITRSDGEVALVNPGLAPGQVAEALVVVASRALDEAALKRSVTAMLQAEVPGLAADLRAEDIELEAGRPRPTALALPNLTGAEVTLQGRAGGERPVTVWVAAVRDTGHSATVLAVVLRGQEQKFLPGARALLASLRWSAAEAVPASTEALVGLEFGHTSFGSDSSLTTVYELRAGGRVRRRTMFSSPLGGSDSEAFGTYTVAGERVTLRVDGDTVVGTLERASGRPVGLKVGAVTYRRL